jgi:hypothetical protein
LPDEFEFPLRSGDAFLGFLLKCVKYINRLAKTDRIDRAVCVALMRRYDLEHDPPAKTFEGFDRGILFSTLRRIQRLAHIALNRPREGLEIPSG